MSYRSVVTLVFMLALYACDDLDPSSQDRRVDAVAGSAGPAVGQVAPDFALFDTLEQPLLMSAELSSADGIVLYFTMWCPICDSHMSHMRAEVVPNFPDVMFYLVDYVSGSIAASRAAQLSNGYGSSSVLVDEALEVLNLYNATMGTTVVIDNQGIVQLNEDYKDGSKLVEVLKTLPR